MQITILEASRHLPQLIRSAQAGEEVVIAEDGQPVARLVPASRLTTNATEVGRGATVFPSLAQHPVPMEACRSAEEIDAAIEAGRPA